jgi:hypothetical protein
VEVKNKLLSKKSKASENRQASKIDDVGSSAMEAQDLISGGVDFNNNSLNINAQSSSAFNFNISEELIKQWQQGVGVDFKIINKKQQTPEKIKNFLNIH